MNFFQSVILSIFALVAIAAVMIFSMSSTGGGNLTFAGTFQLWGTLPADSVKTAIDEFNSANSKVFKVEYVEKRVDTFQNDFISALASGDGPDLILLPETLIVQNMDKVLPISYEAYTVRNFSDTFADGASLFMAKEGIVALPLYIDPLVMYWNKDIFSTGGVASFPTRWGEFEGLAGRLTQADRAGNISQSAVALGTYLNIDHAKDILAALFLQSGNDLLRFSKAGELDNAGREASYQVLLGASEDSVGQESALKFFLDFSNPAKKIYSWNVAMPRSRAAFAGGTLGVYFGLASDNRLIQKVNPHLGYDVAVLPQLDNAKQRVTLGNFYGVAVTRGAGKPDIAKTIAVGMSDATFAKAFSEAVSLPPARRDLLAQGSGDPMMSVFYSSAIISKSWLDPMPAETEQYFQEMTETVLSGVKTEGQAISIVGQKLTNLVKGK